MTSFRARKACIIMSLPFKINLASRQVLRAGVEMSGYLWNVTYKSADTSSIGLVVAAPCFGTVISFCLCSVSLCDCVSFLE